MTKDKRKGIKLRSSQWFELKELFERAYPLVNVRDTKTGDYIPGEYEPRGITLIDYLGLLFGDLNDGKFFCNKHRADGINRVEVKCPACWGSMETHKHSEDKI